MFLFSDEMEVELRMARLEDLMERRPLLLNSVLLRQNPHNVQEWHKRVQLYEGNPQEVSFIFRNVAVGGGGCGLQKFKYAALQYSF